MPLPNLDSLESVIAIVVVFGLLVLVHELGHFLLAKRAGILCREFALGMGPKIFRYKRGETEYTLRLLPIGGMVRMAGEDPEMDVLKTHMMIGVELDPTGKIVRFLLDDAQPQSHNVLKGVLVDWELEHRLTATLDVNGEQRTFSVDPKALLVTEDQEIQIAPYDRQFRGKTVSQRFWAIFAGPAANFILAFVLLVAIGFIYGVPTNAPQIGPVNPGGPAAQAGLQEGDRVIKIDAKPVTSWTEIVDIVSKSPDQTLTFSIERNGKLHQIPVHVENKEKVGKIMVHNPVIYSPTEALRYGAMMTYEFTVMILKGLLSLFTGAVGLKDLSGPVGIFKMTGEFAQQGMSTLLKWAAVLSINLGLFNLLPLPALDGGRLVFLGVEGLRGKPIDPNKEGMVHFLGFAFLMLLILVVTWNDLHRIFFS
ncbi:MAG: RIP metalloprotease RseP [Clostridia bacterium]